MARRFGGAYSPAARDAEGRALSAAPLGTPLRGRARAQMLMALGAVPLVTAFFQGTAVGLAVNLLAAGSLLGSGILTREGLKAAAAWSARRVARRPAVPRKLMGAGLAGLGVMLAAMDGLSGIGPGLVYGVVAAVLHIMSFGPDPMRDKGMEGIDAFQTERVARTVDEAEAHLAAMKDAVLRARDREAEDRVARLAQVARQMFRAVEDSPQELTAARKYLGVYLMAARDATARFADLYAARRDEDAKAEYLALVDDLIRAMEGRRETLLLADRTSLDVEIETLRDRLHRDGLPTGE